ncbi:MULTISPECIES: hypothetical protein [Staphylococcus]|jgi:hypothetical protein|uniref:Uncharacterized protein n=1 Tax=Staphylococcus nepalensis TaxID=214473 RepID=A0A2T4S7M6_9STAP|nr:MULTISPECIES: hypothetical protein [Staphylococcus]MBO1206687.1 hypothetical protein [Staphylococcus nepalensis]MDR5648854.1 hypothetical protein [Staphylococcus nepalensis]PTK57640.1 hypothetical protein BUZ61_12440 [Staphylococcus nepalensis]SUM70558.1 Uncharacterised protein [Staphylococcus nepalensis]SUM96342.1 Uncharacterised protein [Staphylococcus nepalensis]
MSNITEDFENAKKAVKDLKASKRTDFQETEQLIINLKKEVRNDLMPKIEQEDKRLKEIASKLDAHIKTAFESFNTLDEIINYLESAFQRGKKDKAYGRALILLEENPMIEKAKTYFSDKEQNGKFIGIILNKLIELSDEIMPEEYTELLKVEKSFFEVKYSNL